MPPTIARSALDSVAEQSKPESGHAGFLPRVDVHAHYVPVGYRRAAQAAGHRHPDGMPAIPEWDTGKALAMMDGLNIRTAMLSISSPGVHFGNDEAARKLAREVNEEGARLVADHPGRFGLFAAMPLPDVEGAIAEAAYAFDTLHADGVAVETNHHGIYLGDPRLNPFSLSLTLDERSSSCIRPRRPHRALRRSRSASRFPSSSSCSKPHAQSPTWYCRVVWIASPIFG
jgi:predicted TIM-barrel fold metal-dependent hydrolase